MSKSLIIDNYLTGIRMTQVVKRFGKGQGRRVERRLACGNLFGALKVIRETQGTWGTFNTAYVERLNATLRTWIPALMRRSRHAGTEESVEAGFFWVSVVYNFTRRHPSLMQRHLVSGERLDRTPAMALGLIRIPSISVTSRRTLNVPPIPGTRTGSYSFHSEKFRKSYGIIRNRYDRPEVDGRGRVAISPSSAPHGTPRCRVVLPARNKPWLTRSGPDHP